MPLPWCQIPILTVAGLIQIAALYSGMVPQPSFSLPPSWAFRAALCASAADAMVSLGLLEREGSHYRNSAVSAAFLAGGGSGLRPMLRVWDKISYPAWLDLEGAVRRGHGQDDFSRFSEEEQ